MLLFHLLIVMIPESADQKVTLDLYFVENQYII